MSIISENKKELEAQLFPKKTAQEVVDLVKKEKPIVKVIKAEDVQTNREYLDDRAAKKAAQKKDALKRMAVRKDVTKGKKEAPVVPPVIDDIPDPETAETIRIRSKEAKRQEYLKDKAEVKAARIADREKRKAEKPVKAPVDHETKIAEFIKDFEEKKAAGHLTFKDDEYRFALYLPADLYKTLKIKTIQDGTTLSKLIAKQMAKLVEK